MANNFHGDSVVFLGAATFLIFTAYAITRALANRKLPSGGQLAVERLRRLDRGEVLEAKEVVKPIREHKEPFETKLTEKSASPRQIGIDVQTTLECKAVLESQLAARLPLLVGTRVRAVRNFGPVKESTPGIITGLADFPFFWWSRPAYLCTFADNLKVHARPKQIELFDHAHSLEDLEQPDFASILSRQMISRAQQLFSRQCQARSGNNAFRTT